jgi:hypothetical protein
MPWLMNEQCSSRPKSASNPLRSGRTCRSEPDGDDKSKSFELFREHLAGGHLETFDEILSQLRS